MQNDVVRFLDSIGYPEARDELKNVEGAFSISTNTDGGNSYNGSNERYPFSIPGNAADESAVEEVSEQQ